MDERLTLEFYLSFDLSSAQPVLERFAQMDGAIAAFDGGKNNFVYIPGLREDRVLLVAHADTVWDCAYRPNMEKFIQEFKCEDGIYRGTIHDNGNAYDIGLGADDRCGCAMLELLKGSGHSLLLLDGEEHGQKGAVHLRKNHKKLFEELNGHAYAIQLDRRNGTDFKCYNIPVSKEFKSFIQEETGYKNDEDGSCTDIVKLCVSICGVNLSVGYYNEHHADEELVYEEWLNTLNVMRRLLEKPQRRFPCVIQR